MGQEARARRFFTRYAALWLVPLSVLVALLLSEGLLRLYPSLLPEEAQLRLMWRTQALVNPNDDPYLGFVYPPHLRAEIGGGQARFKIVLDEHGFRNASPWPDRASIVVVGDSLAYGWGLTAEQSWAALLEKRLGGGRIITLGLPGAVPQQYARYLERFGIGLQPELVIFTIFSGNDFGDAITFDSWVAAGSPGNFHNWRNFGGSLHPPELGLLERSYLYNLLRSARTSLANEYSSKTIRFENDRRIQLTPGLLQSAIKHSRSGSPGFKSVLQATIKARNLARDSGSRFVVLLFPTREEIYLPLHDTPFPSLFSALQAALEQEGIAYIDLAGRFSQLAAEDKKLYFPVDNHPNSFGNEIVAEVVAEYVRRNADPATQP